MSNRLSLALAEAIRGINPVAKVIGKDRYAIRKDRREFIKAYAADETRMGKALQRFGELFDPKSPNYKVIDQTEAIFSEIVAVSVDEVRVDASVLQGLILPLRDEFKRLKQVKNLEEVQQAREHLNNQKTIEALTKISTDFLDHTEGWFSSIVAHRSLTIQLSDIISLRQEILHLLDRFNLQNAARDLDKDLKKAKKIAALPIKTGPEQQFLDEQVARLQKDVKELMKELETLFTDVIKIMQLEQQKAIVTLNDCLKKLEASGFNNQAPETYSRIKKMYLETTPKTDKIFSNLQSDLNVLIEILREK